jgi:hypothetical protein
VVNLVEYLLVPASLWVWIQTSLKNTNGRHKQRSGQHTSPQEITQKGFGGRIYCSSVHCCGSRFGQIHNLGIQTLDPE